MILPTSIWSCGRSRFNGSTYTLGSSPWVLAGLTSKSTDDNVEHLYFTNTLNSSLDPGFYALVVSNESNFSWSDYGLSYRFSRPMPSPNRVR